MFPGEFEGVCCELSNMSPLRCRRRPRVPSAKEWWGAGRLASPILLPFPFLLHRRRDLLQAARVVGVVAAGLGEGFGQGVEGADRGDGVEEGVEGGRQADGLAGGGGVWAGGDDGAALGA